MGKPNPWDNSGVGMHSAWLQTLDVPPAAGLGHWIPAMVTCRLLAIGRLAAEHELLRLFRAVGHHAFMGGQFVAQGCAMQASTTLNMNHPPGPLQSTKPPGFGQKKSPCRLTSKRQGQVLDQPFSRAPRSRYLRQRSCRLRAWRTAFRSRWPQACSDQNESAPACRARSHRSPCPRE
jgi:hypothetical protein